MRGERSLTLLEVLVTVTVVTVLAVILVSAMRKPRREARMIRCRNMLNQIAKGMWQYLSDAGGGEFYPCPLGRGRNPFDYNGAEWLASLYWTGVIADPGVFLCPSAEDTNANGAHLGATRAGLQFGSQTVSYAGLHWRSASATGSPIREAEWSPNDVMASDDTQGTINHGTGRNAGMSVLFFDSHAEFKTADELDPRTAVGQKGELLEKLKN